MASQVIGFDVYGTLVDPLALAGALEVLAGERAREAAALWRQKQVEYAFRRALMRQYADFDVCTRQALQFTAQALNLPLTDDATERLLDAYRQLPAFPDVLPALRELRAQGYRLVACSNGVAATLRAQLEHVGALALLDDIVSVDEIGTFKPDPAVYAHLVRRADAAPGLTWMVSANAWDVLGAQAAGLRAAWVRRSPDLLFDPWGAAPDLAVPGLAELAAALAALAREG